MKHHAGVCLCALLFKALISFGQASLAAENIIDDIKVTTSAGKQKVYTVCRDARIATQWYYIPNELRVAEEKTTSGKVRPKMTILRYQYQDPSSGATKEGGILVAAFTYAIEPEVIDQVKNQVKARKVLGAPITLSAIPLNTSNIDFLASDSQFIGHVDAKAVSGISGATTASQEMVISYDLTALGASVFSGLAGSSGGIPVRGNITYNGLSAPCGYKITGKWDNVYKYFEENRLIDTRFKFWFVQGGGTFSKNTVKESLNSIQNMNVQVIECPVTPGGDSLHSSDEANMQDLIKTIQSEVLSDSMMTRATELAKLQALYLTADTTERQRLQKLMEDQVHAVQFGYQNSTKNISKRRTGQVNYDFSRQKMIIRPSTLGGLLSFSKYGLTPDQLKEQGYIVDIDANQAFPSVIIGLPNISPDYNLRTVTMDISYTNSAGDIRSEARQWNATTNGWVTPTNAAQGYIRFNLIGETDKKRASEPEFDVKLQVVSSIPNGSFTISKKIKLSSGQRYVDAIELLTKQFVVDASALDYSKTTNNNSDLAMAKLILNKDMVHINKSITPYFNNGVAGPPAPVHVLVPNSDAPEDGKVVFTTSTGKNIDRADPIVPGDNTLGNYEWKTVTQ